MSIEDLGIQRKIFGGQLIASIRENLKSREEIYKTIKHLREKIGEDNIQGPPFCIITFINSYSEGYDAEVGFAVKDAVNEGRITSRFYPEYEVLSLTNDNPADSMGETYQKLFGLQDELGVITDEFCIEVYPDFSDTAASKVELLFVLHRWNDLFAEALDRVFGKQAQEKVMAGAENISLNTTNAQRFEWAKGAVSQLDDLAEEQEKYEVLSCCAHIFPQSQIDKLRAAYLQSYEKVGDMLKAVDAVMDFMIEDPGWNPQNRREGNTIFSIKNPSNPQAFKEAKTKTERDRAYCFCPLIRDHLDEGMSPTFCYCSAGFFRSQWEGAIGDTVNIEIVRSILKGDDECEFAIHLPVK
jgi:effector-binding domain-containing protein